MNCACALFLTPKQCYLAALENRDAPQAPEKFSKPSKVNPPPAPAVDQEDRLPSAPAPPPALLVPPDEEPPDDEFDEDVRCLAIYDFHGNDLRVIGKHKQQRFLNHDRQTEVVYSFVWLVLLIFG